MLDLAYLIPLFPLIGFLITGFFGKKLKSEALIGGIASAAVGLSFAVAATLFFTLTGLPADARSHTTYIFSWLAAGNFNVDVAYQVDQLSIVYALIVTGIGTLIHIYSMGYMHGDKSYPRFFAYLNLFIFMMLNLVLANNFLLTFLGWEGVGLCSYLLIGFWYDRKFEGVNIRFTGDAANKAFIANRIGDFGVLIAMFLIYKTFGTLEYNAVNTAAAVAPPDAGIMTAIALLLFLGSTGKSAQLPLAVWLPDAMAGPTPVSALIHAATMVTAGIFLVARNATLFALAPDAMTVVAVVGVTTALVAATIGIVQNDIKKVLAYSTVSQLGFMFAALGVGAFTAAVFHVMTHACFKALLFLGSGSVIHGMHEEQDIQKMGGLKKYMPVTHRTFLIGTIAISGIPPLAGFFSKDEILWMTFEHGGHGPMWIILAIAAFCTAFYMFRLYYLTFGGKERFDHHRLHPHESPVTMTLPLNVLAFLSVVGGFLGVPYALGFFASDHPNLLENWLGPIFSQANGILGRGEHHSIHAIEYVLMAASIAIATAGILLASKLYKEESEKPAELARKFKGAYNLLLHKYRIDEIYQALVVSFIYQFSERFLWKVFDVKIVDGLINGAAKTTQSAGESLRRIQSGVTQNYALLMIAGIVVILTWLAVG